MAFNSIKAGIRYGICWIREENEFKVDRILRLVTPFLYFFVPALIWYWLGFSRSLEYFFVVHFISLLFYPYALFDRVYYQFRHKGALPEQLRPLNIFLYFYIGFLIWSVIWVWDLIPYILIGFIIKPSLIGILRSLPFFFLSYTYGFFVNLFFASLTFYTEHSEALYRSFYLIEDILAGSIIPIPILRKVHWILNFLPFQCRCGLVWDVYLGKNILKAFLLYLFWISFFGILSFIIWKKGERRIEIFGV